MKNIMINWKSILITLISGLAIGSFYGVTLKLVDIDFDFYIPLGVLIFVSSLLADKCFNKRSYFILNTLFIFSLFSIMMIISDYSDVVLRVYGVDIWQFVLANILVGLIAGLLFGILSMLFRLVKVSEIFYLMPIVLFLFNIFYSIFNTYNDILLYIVLIINVTVLIVYVALNRDIINKKIRLEK